MPTPCLAPSPQIDLQIVPVTGSSPGLQATPILSPIFSVWNGLENLADGMYAPGYDDLLGAGFPAVPGAAPADLLVKTTTVANLAWTFRYNPLSTASNKWEFIGGAAHFVSDEASGTITPSQASGTFGAWGSMAGDPGPDFVVPFTGLYTISFGAVINGIDNVNQGEVGLNIVGSGVDPVDDRTAVSANTSPTSVSRTTQWGLNSGDLVRMLVRGMGTGTYGFRRRWMLIQPVRVSGARAGSTYGGT